LLATQIEGDAKIVRETAPRCAQNSALQRETESAGGVRAAIAVKSSGPRARDASWLGLALDAGHPNVGVRHFVAHGCCRY
jgi:hypothetical protein